MKTSNTGENENVENLKFPCTSLGLDAHVRTKVGNQHANALTLSHFVLQNALHTWERTHTLTCFLV